MLQHTKGTSFKEVDELKSLILNEFQTETVHVDSHNLVFNDRTFQVGFGNQFSDTDITVDALTKLCSLFKFPYSYVKNIPPDLIKKNLDQLPQLTGNRGINLLHNPKRNVITGVAYDNIACLSYTDCLVGLQELSEKGFSPKGNSYISDSEIAAFMVNEKKENLAKDEYFAGGHIFNGALGFRQPAIQAALYRLICLNGAVMPLSATENEIKIRGGDGDYLFERYMKVLNEVNLNTDWFSSIFDFGKSNPLTFKSAGNVYGKMRRFTGSEEYADNVLKELGIGDSKQIYSQIAREEEMESETSFETGANLYQTFNAMTKQAQILNRRPRTAAEKLAGSWIVNTVRELQKVSFN